MAKFAAFVTAATWQLHLLQAAPVPIQVSAMPAAMPGVVGPAGRWPPVTPVVAAAGRSPVATSAMGGVTAWQRQERQVLAEPLSGLSRTKQRTFSEIVYAKKRSKKAKVDENAISRCPGMSDITEWGNFCGYDNEHRLCGVLLDGEGKPLEWEILPREYPSGAGKMFSHFKEGNTFNYWQIVGDGLDHGYVGEMNKNKGDSYCLTVERASKLINWVGCENMQIRCEATDTKWIEDTYMGGGDKRRPRMAKFKECVKQQCPQGVKTPPIVTPRQEYWKNQEAAEAEKAKGETETAEEPVPALASVEDHTLKWYSVIVFLAGSAVGGVATAVAMRPYSRPASVETLMIG